jgi:16S rRNA (guanine966-N2)-methyltransferase
MKPPPRNAPGTVRIVGGRWRGTRLAVPSMPGLRPSSDRVRETLFNWLMPMLPGAQVVDLFAGTGALGLEAVSRGAARATLVERAPALASSLADVVQRLSAHDSVEVVRDDTLAWLARQPHAAFDLAFVDPPFDADLWPRVLPLLHPALAPGGWLYVESPAGHVPALSPSQWTLHREGGTRDVRYALYRAVARGGADTLANGQPAAATE